MIGTTVVDYHKNPTLKHALWCGLNVSMAAGLSTLSILGGPIIAQACLGTGCVVGGLSLLASKAAPGSLQKYEAPLGMGLGGLVAVGLGNLIFPMPFLFNVMLYGGLAVFSGMLLKDTQQLLDAAQNNEFCDPINESLGIYLDTINIFKKIAIILFELQKEPKRRRRGEGDAK